MYVVTFLNADSKICLITIPNMIFINFTVLFYSEQIGISIKPDIRIITYPYTVMRSVHGKNKTDYT